MLDFPLALWVDCQGMAGTSTAAIAFYPRSRNTTVVIRGDIRIQLKKLDSLLLQARATLRPHALLRCSINWPVASHRWTTSSCLTVAGLWTPYPQRRLLSGLSAHCHSVTPLLLCGCEGLPSVRHRLGAHKKPRFDSIRS